MNAMLEGRNRRNAAVDDVLIAGARNVVFVIGVKGGVGTSTIAANLAVALAGDGLRVGLVDADVQGSAMATMFGVVRQSPQLPRVPSGPRDGLRLEPLERFGVKLMSTAFIVEDEKCPLLWRGSRLDDALLQLVEGTAWNGLDLLLLDVPASPRHAVLTLSSRMRTSGAILVTTPQELALREGYKALTVCRRAGLPLLGVVENQTEFACSGCHTVHRPLGVGAGERLAEAAGVPVLGRIPQQGDVRIAGDTGTFVVNRRPSSNSARALLQASDALLGKLRGPTGAPQLAATRQSEGAG